MKCVVTGGAGFIGSHLVDHLLDAGHQVVVIDNLAAGREANLEPHRGNTRFQFLRADVADHADIRPAFDGADRVFHLAALADIVPSVERPLEYHRANVDGTISVLEASRGADVKRFVYAASSSCYGLATEYPTSEAAAIRPEYPYALTKYLGERYVLFWNELYGLPTISVRFFNVYGPRARTNKTYGAVFGVFLAQRLAQEPFTLVGDGTQTRDFTYVTDAVRALVLAADSDRAGEVYNVGSGGTYSINHLVSLLQPEPPLDVEHLPKRPGEPDCTFADITKIRRDLGYEPRVSFEFGVREMLAHIADWRDAPVWSKETIAGATKAWFAYLARKSP
jgi:UDP-glucose 4-epimerase